MSQSVQFPKAIPNAQQSIVAIDIDTASTILPKQSDSKPLHLVNDNPPKAIITKYNFPEVIREVQLTTNKIIDQTEDDPLQQQQKQQKTDQKAANNNSELRLKFVEVPISELTNLWALRLIAIYLGLIIIGICTTLLVSCYNHRNIFQFLNVPISAFSYGLLQHTLFRRHSFVRVSITQSLWPLFAIYTAIVYCIAVGWEALFQYGYIEMYNFIFFLLPILSCVLYSSLMLILNYGKVLYKRVSYYDAEKVLHKGVHYEDLYYLRVYQYQVEASDVVGKIGKDLQQQNSNNQGGVNKDIKRVYPQNKLPSLQQKQIPQQKIKDIKRLYPQNKLPPLQQKQRAQQKIKDIKRINQQNKLPPLQQKQIPQQKMELVERFYEPDIESESISIQNFILGMSLILLIQVIQIVFAIDLTTVFNFLLSHGSRFLPIVCSLYPTMMGVFHALTEKINKKFGLELKWELEFLQLMVAGLPYRLIFFVASQWPAALPIFAIKIFYKSLIYIIVPVNREKIDVWKAEIKNKFGLTINLDEQASENGEESYKKNITKTNVVNIDHEQIIISQTVSMSKPLSQQQLSKNDTQNNNKQKIKLSAADNIFQKEQNAAIQQSDEQVWDDKARKKLVQRFCILQFSDILNSVCVQIILIFYHYAFGQLKNALTTLSTDSILTLTYMMLVETSIDVIIFVTFPIILSKYSQHFKQLTFRHVLRDLFLFLQDGIHYLSTMTFLCYATVFLFLNNIDLFTVLVSVD